MKVVPGCDSHAQQNTICVVTQFCVIGRGRRRSTPAFFAWLLVSRHASSTYEALYRGAHRNYNWGVANWSFLAFFPNKHCMISSPSPPPSVRTIVVLRRFFSQLYQRLTGLPEPPTTKTRSNLRHLDAHSSCTLLCCSRFHIDHCAVSPHINALHEAGLFPLCRASVLPMSDLGSS